MKFIHFADMHFDTAFSLLNSKNNLGEIRRLDQREVFRKIIEIIKKENIPYLFIAGDLYEHKTIRQSTIEYINNKFKEIPNTQIFISPGNHDPYLKNSYYSVFTWNSNVHIFKDEVEIIETKEADIYGYGFTDFNCVGVDINNIIIKNPDKTNILLIHGTLDGSDKLEDLYNPLSSIQLRKIGFDYIALGHIHKTNYQENKTMVYPGSTVSMGFDELGEHGIIKGEISEKQLQIEFIKMDDKVFVEKQIDCTEINSQEELVENLNNLELKQNEMYKIILTGQKNFNINTNGIIKLIQQENIIKIKDRTKKIYNLEELKNESSLKGLFVKNMIEKLEKKEIDNNKFEKAIEIGLEILE